MKGNFFSREMVVAANQNKEEREFWLDVLSGDWVKSSFPYQGKTMLADERNMASVEFSIYEDLVLKLFKLSNRDDYTLHMVLTAALIALLKKYGNSNDIIIGTPIYKQEIETELINTKLVLRTQLEDDMCFRELLLKVKQNIVQAVENQNYPVEILSDQLNMSSSDHNYPFFDVAILLENIQAQDYLDNTIPNMIFSFLRTDMGIKGVIEYNSSLYKRNIVEGIISHFINLLHDVLKNIHKMSVDIEILSGEEKKRQFVHFNSTEAKFPENKTIYKLFEEQSLKFPGKIAVVYDEEHINYEELEQQANRLACYLSIEKKIGPECLVGILMKKSINCMVAILGILKAGGAYVPIDRSLPVKKIKHIINDAKINIVISEKEQIKTLNNLQWECEELNTYLIMDSMAVDEEEEVEKSGLMDRKLWEYIGETGIDDITGGGWKSSYTGEAISKEEMDEYGDNILKKLLPLLHKKMRVLEIGCATGLSMYRIAPKVGLYYGTDLSPVIIKKNEQRIKSEGYDSIKLSALPAHEIDKIDEGDFELVIMNSVIQHFHGHNYLRKVLRKAIDLVGNRGYLFVGDVMDLKKKEALIQEMVEFKHNNREGNYKTKTDWSEELFISQRFFEDLRIENPEIDAIDFSGKIRTIENELTKFRYDVIVTIDKTGKNIDKSQGKHKYQDDLRVLQQFDNKRVVCRSTPADLAYIIYTSGTTGLAKGVMINHRNVVRLMHNDKFLFDFDSEDIWTMFHSYCFDFSVWEMYGAFLHGGKLVIIPGKIARDSLSFLEVLKREKVTVLNQTPSAFYVLQDLIMNRHRLYLRYVIFGGEALNPAKLKKWKNMFPETKLVNMFGITETTVHVTYKQLSGREIDSGISNIGKPIPTLQTYVFDRNLNLLPPGTAGELYVGGEGVGRGYLNRPELTGSYFLRNPYKPGDRLYRSGDLVKLPGNGEMEYLGRIDHQVKIRGYRIELGEIEIQLLKHIDIKEAVVLPRMHEDGDKYLSACFISNRKMDNSELREYLLSHLPVYMIPAYFVQVDKFPMTKNGKIDINRLPAPIVGTSGNDDISPLDEVQEKLAGIWAEILRIDKNTIGIDDDFFELGGHSLKATIFVSRVHKELNVKLPIAEVFGLATIRELAEYIRHAPERRFFPVRPVEKKEYYELSSSQKRLYVLQEMEPESITYNMKIVITIEGDLSRDILENTFIQLINRHDVLRTSFRVSADFPVTRINDDIKFAVEYFDLMNLSMEFDPVHEYTDEASIINGFIRAFDLARAPLFRVGLIKTAEFKHILITDMHHIISDEVSQNIFIRDFISLFNGTGLPSLNLQYKDYSEWQNNEKNKEKFKKQETYWLKRLEGVLPVLSIPADYPRPQIQSFTGSVIHFKIEKEQAEELNKVALKEGVTIQMLMMAIFYILLHKVTGQEDIILGTPAAGRRHADLDNVVGVFVNTIVLRNFPSKEKTFHSFLHEVKKNSLEAYENQDYPFESLTDKVIQERDVSRNPIFDIMFEIRNQDQKSGNERDNRMHGLVFKPYEHKKTDTKFDQDWMGIEVEGELHFSVSYCSKLYRSDSIELLIDKFLVLINDILKDLFSKIMDLNCQTSIEKEINKIKYKDIEINF